MRFSILASLIAVAYAAAVSEGLACPLLMGGSCVVTSGCCGGSLCEPLKRGAGADAEKRSPIVRLSEPALLLADRCVRCARYKSLFLVCTGGGTGKASRRGNGVRLGLQVMRRALSLLMVMDNVCGGPGRRTQEWRDA